VPRGTLATILGPSGCGKTTTLRMIAGLESPTGGSIHIDGQDVTRLGAAERNVSMVFQSYALFPHLRVIDNVAYGLDVAGVSRATARQRARAAMELVGLVGYDERSPSELSGGQQQRVAVARALVLEPSVMLFDEPLSNLDARLRRSMREEIRALQQRLRLTVAYVTHDQAEALAVSDQVIVMDGGRIAQAGTPRDLYDRPATAFVAGFMGEALLFDAQVQADGLLALGPLRIAPPASVGPLVPGPVTLAVRPEAWQVGPGPLVADGADDAASLPATLTKLAYLGSTCEASFDTPLGPVFVVAPLLTDGVRPGAALRLTLSGRGVAVVGGGR
jgi:iron(III) transport system ATP-binding protein